jgi:hypothetical protein
MKRFHISIAVSDFAAALADYNRRLQAQPCVVADGRYALWRTDILNLSISCKPGQTAGVVRHVGFEDDNATGFSEDQDSAGLTWEYFSPKAQLQEIREKIPEAIIKGQG